MTKPFNMIKFKARTDITSLPVTPFVIVEKINYNKSIVTEEADSGEEKETVVVDRQHKTYYRVGDNVVFEEYDGTVEDLLNTAKDQLTEYNQTDRPSFILWDKGTMVVAFYKGETLSASYNLVVKNWIGVVAGLDVQFVRLNKIGLCYDFITHVDKYDNLGGTC